MFAYLPNCFFTIWLQIRLWICFYPLVHPSSYGEGGVTPLPGCPIYSDAARYTCLSQNGYGLKLLIRTNIWLISTILCLVCTCVVVSLITTYGAKSWETTHPVATVYKKQTLRRWIPQVESHLFCNIPMKDPYHDASTAKLRDNNHFCAPSYCDKPLAKVPYATRPRNKATDKRRTMPVNNFSVYLRRTDGRYVRSTSPLQCVTNKFQDSMQSAWRIICLDLFKKVVKHAWYIARRAIWIRATPHKRAAKLPQPQWAKTRYAQAVIYDFECIQPWKLIIFQLFSMNHAWIWHWAVKTDAEVLMPTEPPRWNHSFYNSKQHNLSLRRSPKVKHRNAIEKDFANRVFAYYHCDCYARPFGYVYWYYAFVIATGYSPIAILIHRADPEGWLPQIAISQSFLSPC